MRTHNGPTLHLIQIKPCATNEGHWEPRLYCDGQRYPELADGEQYDFRPDIDGVVVHCEGLQVVISKPDEGVFLVADPTPEMFAEWREANASVQQRPV
jgi:hypothetical protein